jgi:diguanylate cyclase (GGDEF)-like protein
MPDRTFDARILENDFAIAVSSGLQQPFAAVNDIFSTIFNGIDNPGKLRELITSKTENKTVIKHNGGYWELLELKIEGNRTVHLLKNISYEMIILRKLKDQLKKLTDTNSMYSDILSRELPVGVLVIDKDYNVIFVNDTLKRHFHIPSRAKLLKCYNYVTEIKPCKECILKEFEAGGSKKKKTFTVDDKLITSAIHPLEGGKYILVFRDTTKEINLIKEIKTQQENLEKANKRIAEQNDILKRLSNINIRIGQLEDLEAILETVINAIMETFKCRKGAVLLFSRVGLIENAVFTKKITSGERGAIIKSINAAENGKGAGLKNFMVMDIGGEQPNGRVFLSLPNKEEKDVDRSILELFLMEVNIYLENLKLRRKLEELAQTDSLTGVFNRYYFDKQFEKEKEVSLRFGQPLSLIILDVNGLKYANDVIGHEAGDTLLKETAALLGRCAGTYDSIYRIGGDEFVILLSNCTEERLAQMLDGLKEAQADAAFEFKGQTVPVRFSLGGACSTKISHNKLKDEADKRMYRDKKAYYETHERYR